MYYSVYYINILITMFLTTFRRFPTTFRRFPKTFQNCSEGLLNVSKHFPNIFRRLPKVAEDFRGSTDDVSIIQHHLWVLFKRLCSYSNGNLKTCDNNLISSHVKLSYLFWLVSGRNWTNPAIWLVPGAGGIFSSGPPQRAESVELIYSQPFSWTNCR